MAQLFNVYFPKYYFLLQREFCIEFDSRLPLPFNYWISSKGKCYVEDVYYDDTRYTQKDIQNWKLKGLQKGLTIIQINNEKLYHHRQDDEYTDNDYDNDTDLDQDDEDEDKEQSNNLSYYSQNEELSDTEINIDLDDHSVTKHKSNLDEILQTFMNNAESTEVLTIKFREELAPSQDELSQPLGMQYISPPNEDEKTQSLEFKNMRISASSCQKGYKPTECRLNNPKSFWKPSEENEWLRSVWISFDLSIPRSITRIHIQGDLSHNNYVKSLWIDYSDDGCKWISHPMRIITCKYQESMDYMTAEIEIWPTIHAQFVRIRPYDWNGHIAMRCELYGLLNEYNEECRVVTLDTVNEKERSKLLKVMMNKSRNTKAVQLDCKAIIATALERARISSYAMIPVDEDHFICTFTTPNSDVTERMYVFII